MLEVFLYNDDKKQVLKKEQLQIEEYFKNISKDVFFEWKLI